MNSKHEKNQEQFNGWEFVYLLKTLDELKPSPRVEARKKVYAKLLVDFTAPQFAQPVKEFLQKINLIDPELSQRLDELEAKDVSLELEFVKALRQLAQVKNLEAQDCSLELKIANKIEKSIQSNQVASVMGALA